MNQQALDLNLCTRRTRKMELLELMEDVVPWREFVPQLTAVAPPKGTIIAAPSSTKNSTGKRDPEMHQTKKGNKWHHGMKAHIGADADSGLVHAVVGTAANVNDVTQAHALEHGTEADVYADAGYQGVAKHEEVQDVDATWHIAMRPGKRRALDKQSPLGSMLDRIEQLKASIRAKVEHPVSGYQAPVWSHQGSLPWIEEEHGAALHPIYVLESVDSEEAIYANHCMSPKYCQTVGIDRQRG